MFCAMIKSHVQCSTKSLFLATGLSSWERCVTLKAMASLKASVFVIPPLLDWFFFLSLRENIVINSIAYDIRPVMAKRERRNSSPYGFHSQAQRKIVLNLHILSL